METQEVEVKSKSEIVGTASFSKYDSAAEAVEAEGDEAIVAYINSMTKTNAMNACRAAATTRPTKSRLKTEAFSRVSVEEFQACAGDGVKIDALLAEKMKEIEAELAAGGSALEDEAEE